MFKLQEEHQVLKSLLKRGCQERCISVNPPGAKTLPPAVKPAREPAAPPVGGIDPMDYEEFPQLQRLHDLKKQGFQRQSPNAPPVRKSFNCAACNIQFDGEENLGKHKDAKHSEKKDPGKEAANVALNNEAAVQRIPILNGQAREYNCQDCSFQADGRGSSKSLLRHFKQTGHKTSSLEEKCYICQKVCSNFEELILHRRENHRDNINLCRYLSEDSCKFGDRCWYSHNQTKNNDCSKKNVGFPKAKESLPPDVMQGLTVLLSDLTANHLEKKKSPGV